MQWQRFGLAVSILSGSCSAAAEVLLIGSHPGGHEDRMDHGVFSVDGGSVYTDEKRDADAGYGGLQLQVRGLFARLGQKPKDVLAGNLVPFRAPRWKHVVNKKDSLKFGTSLWRDVLPEVRPSLVIGMGRPVAQALTTIFEPGDLQSIPVG